MKSKLFKIAMKIVPMLPKKWQAKIYSFLIGKAIEGKTGKKLPFDIKF